MSVSWQEAALVAALTALAGFAARLVFRKASSVAAVLLECAVLFALYALWQLILDLTVTTTRGAVSHGRWLWQIGRGFHLPSERSVQRAILPHQSLVTFFNHYYLITHYTGLLLCLAWAFFWHRPMYRWCRRMLVITTAMLTVPFQSIPVAPPRLLPELGLVDTTHVTSLRPLLNGLHDPGQLTAMPSVHVAWAVLVAVLIICVSSSVWRWLAIAYPVMTTLAVVSTGNHFWADGIVGAAIVAAVIAADRLVSQMRSTTAVTESMPVGIVGRHDTNFARPAADTDTTSVRAEGGAGMEQG